MMIQGGNPLVWAQDVPPKRHEGMLHLLMSAVRSERRASGSNRLLGV